MFKGSIALRAGLWLALLVGSCSEPRNEVAPGAADAAIPASDAMAGAGGGAGPVTSGAADAASPVGDGPKASAPPAPDAKAPAPSDAIMMTPAGSTDAAPPPPAGRCAPNQCNVYPNATSTCDPNTGYCSMPVCESGYGDCDGTLGCETPLQTDGQNCGSCGHFCPSACAFGRCQCGVPSASNLVPGAGFDHDIAGWSDGFMLDKTWQADDGSACPTSGSMHLHAQFRTNPGQSTGVGTFLCVPAQAGVEYNFGAWLRTYPNTGSGGALFLFFTKSPTCDSATQISGTQNYPVAGGAFAHAGGTITAPAGTNGVQVWFTVDFGHDLEVDNVYFSPAPARF